MKTGMLKMWLMMSLISFLVLLSYNWLFLYVDITDIVRLSMLCGLIFMTIGLLALSLGLIILAFGFTDKNSAWYMGIAVGIITLFAAFIASIPWPFLLVGFIGIAICFRLYFNYMSDTPYNKIYVSVFALLFLLGFGISVYLLRSGIENSIVSFVITYTLPLTIAIFDVVRYKKNGRSLFVK